MCEIETAEAEHFYDNELKMPSAEQKGEEQALTYWWAENFNQLLDTTSSHRVINSTHIVEFSE